MKPIRIFTPDLEFLTEIDDYESLIFTRRWYKPGEFELHINRHKKDVDKLLKGNIIVLDKETGKAGRIAHREIGLDENGKASEQWRIIGHALAAVTDQRITMPPAGLAHDSITSSAETVMKHYVDAHLINPADANRKIDLVLNAQDQGRGSSFGWQSRLKSVADELEKISMASGLGWNVYPDLTQKKWVFEVYEGQDLTAGQSINPPVIFSTDLDAIKGQRYAESDIGYKNLGYVGGQGEGVDRTIITVPQIKYALEFDGVDDYVDCGNNSIFNITDALTIEMVVKLDSASSGLGGVVKGLNGAWASNSYGLRASGARYRFYITDGTTVEGVYMPTIAEEFCHFAGVTSKALGKIIGYRNGEKIDEITRTIDNIRIQSGDLQIGTAYTGAYTKGMIKEVRIWNVSRIQQQIKDNMNKELTGNEAGLVGYWKFQEGAGPTVYDSTPNGNGGTIYGGATWAMPQKIQEADVGLDRHEVFIDARDISEVSDLQARGEQRLAEMDAQVLFEAQILTYGPFIYGQDWDLGDVVTVQSKDWGVTLDARIIEIKEIYEPSGFKLETVFGNSWPTLIGKLRQELGQISNEITK